MYNRASADPDGKPWSERKRLLHWDEEQQKWVGPDVPDFEPTKSPHYRPDWAQAPQGHGRARRRLPVHHDRRRQIVGVHAVRPQGRAAAGALRAGRIAGPQSRFIAQQQNPVAKIWERDDNQLHAVADPRFPYALTTYRVTEHHSGGMPTRTTPVLAELQPENFAEISPELAHELGIANLDWVTLSTARGEVEVKALVTERLRPFQHRWRHRASGRHALAFRLGGIRDRRHRQCPDQRRRRPEYQHARSQGADLQSAPRTRAS